MRALPDDSFEPWRPLTRRDHLVMTQVGDEVVVYDEITQAIHSLNPTSRLVWSLCDGIRTPAVLAQKAGEALGAEVSEDIVQVALGQLVGANLLLGVIPTELGEPRQSRRVLLRRAVVAGGIALPVLVSVSAPAAAQAISCSSVICGHIDCNRPFCNDSGECRYLSAPQDQGLSCNGGSGICDNIGNCNPV